MYIQQKHNNNNDFFSEQTIRFIILYLSYDHQTRKFIQNSKKMKLHVHVKIQLIRKCYQLQTYSSYDAVSMQYREHYIFAHKALNFVPYQFV